MSDDLVKHLRESGSRSEVELYEDREQAADRIEQLEQRLFQCATDLQIYMDAHADSEAKLKEQTHLIEQFFALLDKVEETDDGRSFHPNQLRSCRALDTEKLDKILAELKGPTP